MKNYSVRFKNVSEQKIDKARGIWGGYRLIAGYFSPRKKEDTGYAGGRTNIGLNHPIPDKAGASWTNAKGEQVKYLVTID